MKNTNKPTYYYAVIFTSKHSPEMEGYNSMSQHMETLANQQSGFLGMESAKDTIGITVSYWESLEAIKKWKSNSEHLIAQHKGKEQWYEWYKVRICKVERDYNSLHEGDSNSKFPIFA